MDPLNNLEAGGLVLSLSLIGARAFGISIEPTKAPRKPIALGYDPNGAQVRGLGRTFHQTDFVSVMRKVKVVDPVAETTSFLFTGTRMGCVMRMAVCCPTHCGVQLTLE